VGDEVTRESLATLRADLDDLDVRLDQSARAAEDLPHRREYLLLANDFLRRYVELHRELVDRVERGLD
jgi:hypothetical protein